MLQKKTRATPLGTLLIRSGKVSYSVVEMMVHEQIRQAVKEIQAWQNISFSFTNKDIKTHDNIHLPVQVFIQPESLIAASNFLVRQEGNK